MLSAFCRLQLSLLVFAPFSASYFSVPFIQSPSICILDNFHYLADVERKPYSSRFPMDSYQLRCQLRGHEDHARGICICGNAGIATSSRDKTVRFWTLDESNRGYTISKILLGHTSLVGPLSWIPPNEELPEGGIISGGMDTLVIMWNLASGEKVQMLKGHKLQVTGIVLDGSDVLSVSVDCTLRRWRGGQQVGVFEAHNADIQAIAKLPSGELVTGSSDMTLKLWKGDTCIHTFLGHTDTVRGVAVMPNLGVLSASHDGSIRLWAISGELLMEMVGHTSIVYSVDAHPSGLIVSASEDCSAKIWKDGVCVQSIDHPGCVWDAKFLENGDFVTACSDGVVRIWTIAHDRIADAVELDSFASQLSHSKGMLVGTAQFDGILEKISEFNNVLLSHPENQNLSLNEDDISRLSAIVKTLKDTSHCHSTTFSDDDVALMLKCPNSMLFLVIKFAMIALHPDGADKLLQHLKNKMAVAEYFMDVTRRPIHIEMPLEKPFLFNASSTLLVEGLPVNCTRREVSHIFRPYVGFKEVRRVTKKSKQLCFVEFTNPDYASTAMRTLKRYKFDKHDPNSATLRLQYAQQPGARSGR